MRNSCSFLFLSMDEGEPLELSHKSLQANLFPIKLITFTNRLDVELLLFYYPLVLSSKDKIGMRSVLENFTRNHLESITK